MPEANRLSRMISTAAVVVVFFAAFTAVASATDYYVRTGGLDDPGHDGLANDDVRAWKTISYAIDRDEVTAGDTIHVAAGEYSENVNVNKSITLEGEGADVVTVTAEDAEDHVLEVTAGYVGISGFTVRGAMNWNAGIYLHSVDHCNISSTITSGNEYGIYLDCSSNNNLIGNNVSGNNDDGIYMRYSSNNTLTGNNASGNDDYGIYLWYSSNNTLTGNNAFGNNDGIDLWYSSNNTLTGNNASGNNDDGICLLYSSNNTLTGNNASGNDDDGTYMDSSSNNTLTGNTASNNGCYGICMWYSSNNNFIYHNNLLSNTIKNAYDSSTNRWNSTTEGNYYSDYTGNDANNDGIGDDPHPIPGGSNMDYHPLMNPWHEPQTPGDLNGDGKITPADAGIALRIAAGGSASYDPTTLAAADVSGDGKVTSLDALMILQAAAGNMSL